MLIKNNESLSPFFDLWIGGKRIAYRYRNMITEIQFEDSSTEAGLLRVSLFDKNYEFTNAYSLIEGTPITLDMGFVNHHRVMFKGEITHIEGNFDESGVRSITIGAINKSNKMTSIKKSRSWSKKTKSQVVASIAREYGFRTIIQNTEEVIDKITQENESDAELIKKLAEDEGFEFYVFPDSNVLFFGDSYSNAKVYGSLYYDCGDYTIRSFSPTLTERNKKKKVKHDGHKGKGKSHKTGKNKKAGNKGGKDAKGGGGSGSYSSSPGASFTVEVEDEDDNVGIIGLTGAEKRRKR